VIWQVFWLSLLLKHLPVAAYNSGIKFQQSEKE
jgi:hypothetical protein